MSRYVPFSQRHGSQDIPVLRPIADEPVNVRDPSAFPNFAEAIDYARRKRTANDG